MRAIQTIYQCLNFKFIIGFIIGIVPAILFLIGQGVLSIAVHTSSLEHPNTFLGFFGLCLQIMTVILYSIIFPAMLVMLFFHKLRMVSYGLVAPLLIVPIASLYYFGSMGAWCGVPLGIVILFVLVRQLLSTRRQRAMQASGPLQSSNELDPQA